MTPELFRTLLLVYFGFSTVVNMIMVSKPPKESPGPGSYALSALISMLWLFGVYAYV